MIFANLASFVGNIVFNHGTRLFKRGMTSGNIFVRKFLPKFLNSRQKKDILLAILAKAGIGIAQEEEFSNAFGNLVAKRNMLAHRKIKVSDCGNFLKIYNCLEDLKQDKCDCSNHNDKSKISKIIKIEILLSNFFYLLVFLYFPYYPSF